jgi:hypothetical protein
MAPPPSPPQHIADYYAILGVGDTLVRKQDRNNDGKNEEAFCREIVDLRLVRRGGHGRRPRPRPRPRRRTPSRTNTTTTTTTRTTPKTTNAGRMMAMMNNNGTTAEKESPQEPDDDDDDDDNDDDDDENDIDNDNNDDVIRTTIPTSNMGWNVNEGSVVWKHNTTWEADLSGGLTRQIHALYNNSTNDTATNTDSKKSTSAASSVATTTTTAAAAYANLGSKHAAELLKEAMREGNDGAQVERRAMNTCVTHHKLPARLQ